MRAPGRPAFLTRRAPMQSLIDLFLHLDKHLAQLSQALGPWLYGLLFLIVFCETGLVVTPFLPGDSLLFAAGAIASLPGSHLNVTLLGVLLAVAAVAGDAVNYAAGAYTRRVFGSKNWPLINPKHLLRTQQFYERYGGKTIILARFIPIIRTFAPFVAGVGHMRYARFALYNVVGGIFWVAAFLLGGYWFGERVKGYFHIVILAIIVISILPAVLEVILARRRKPEPQAAAAAPD